MQANTVSGVHKIGKALYCVVIPGLLFWIVANRHNQSVQPNAHSGQAINTASMRKKWNTPDLPFRDVKKYQMELTSGSQVELVHLNGSVTLETTDSRVAAIEITRSAATAHELNWGKVTVARTPMGLRIVGEEVPPLPALDDSEVRQRVKLKLPRHIALLAEKIKGGVDTVGLPMIAETAL